MFFQYLLTGAILITIVLFFYKKFLEPLLFPEIRIRREQLKKTRQENAEKAAELDASEDLLDEVKTSKKIDKEQEKLDKKIESV